MSIAAVIALLSGFLGLGVLAALGLKSYRQVRSLGATVARSADRIAEAGGPPPMSSTGQSDGPPAANTW
ncbi:MAG TPA: hypothetical protein VNA12_01120 [Mycobacteriales bacterium]|nr:hypothetical protein [Mycobacteriales bacterium]